jgi:hypothetical protein
MSTTSATRSAGWSWSPKRACKRAPSGLPDRPLADDATDDHTGRICRSWTDELLADLENMERGPIYDGTLSSLIRVYRTDNESPFKALKHSIRIRDYEPSLRLIDKTVGKRVVAQLKGEDFRRWYREWGSKGPHTRRPRGHSQVAGGRN